MGNCRTHTDHAQNNVDTVCQGDTQGHTDCTAAVVAQGAADDE
ncbi:hypothetical protein [Neisseria dentiae]